ncbi:MAG: hypothetical protein KME16_19995 [Scytolyngbya sp. HA4215-MV1]|jgi:hypothetical protein|nr:hypothetical protein [Scytolyngbya sp. HA4215-MV1]
MIADERPNQPGSQSPFEVAQDAASEALEALYTVYWADRFQADLLEAKLAELILFYTKEARPLSEPHPHPEQLEGEETGTIAPSILPEQRIETSTCVTTA